MNFRQNAETKLVEDQPSDEPDGASPRQAPAAPPSPDSTLPNQAKDEPEKAPLKTKCAAHPARSSRAILLCAFGIAAALTTLNFLTASYDENYRDKDLVTVANNYRSLKPEDEPRTLLMLHLRLARYTLLQDPLNESRIIRKLATFYLHKGDDATAAKYLERYLILKFKSAALHEAQDAAFENRQASHLLCLVNIRRGDYAEAKRVFERQYAESPPPSFTNARDYDLAARIYGQLGDLPNKDKSIKLANACRLMPNDFDGDVFGTYWSDEYLSRAECTAKALYYSGRVCMSKGEYTKARAIFRMLIDNDIASRANRRFVQRSLVMLPVVSMLEHNPTAAGPEFKAALAALQALPSHKLEWNDPEIFARSYAEFLRMKNDLPNSLIWQRKADNLRRQIDQLPQQSPF